MRSHSPSRATESSVSIDRSRSSTRLDAAGVRRTGCGWFGRTTVRSRSPTGAFDGALNLLSSLGYAGDEGDRTVLGEIRRVLRPGGRLVIETNHRDRLPPRSLLREWYPLGDGAFLLTESRIDRVGGTVELTHTYLPAGGPPADPHDPLAGLFGDRALPDPRGRGLRGDRLLREPRWWTVRGRHASRHRGDHAGVTGGRPHDGARGPRDPPGSSCASSATTTPRPSMRTRATPRSCGTSTGGRTRPRTPRSSSPGHEPPGTPSPERPTTWPSCSKATGRLIGGCRIEIRIVANGSRRSRLRPRPPPLGPGLRDRGHPRPRGIRL